MISEKGFNDAGILEPVDFEERSEYKKILNLIDKAKTFKKLAQIADHLTDENSPILRKALGEKLVKIGYPEEGNRNLVAAERARLRQSRKLKDARAEKAQQDFENLYKE